MDAAGAASLRSVVHDCLAKHLYEAAAFFADKLVTLSGYAPAEVYTLAQVAHPCPPLRCAALRGS